jgi:hypothetical protein
MTGKIKSHHTWQEYLRRTSAVNSKKHDALRSATTTTAPQRWSAATRWIYQDVIIQGKYTGNKLGNLSLDKLMELQNQLTNSTDQALVRQHIAQVCGTQPGPSC